MNHIYKSLVISIALTLFATEAQATSVLARAAAFRRSLATFLDRPPSRPSILATGTSFRSTISHGDTSFVVARGTSVAGRTERHGEILRVDTTLGDHFSLYDTSFDYHRMTPGSLFRVDDMGAPAGGSRTMLLRTSESGHLGSRWGETNYSFMRSHSYAVNAETGEMSKAIRYFDIVNPNNGRTVTRLDSFTPRPGRLEFNLNGTLNPNASVPESFTHRVVIELPQNLDGSGQSAIRSYDVFDVPGQPHTLEIQIVTYNGQMLRYRLPTAAPDDVAGPFRPRAVLFGHSPVRGAIEDSMALARTERVQIPAAHSASGETASGFFGRTN